MNKEIQFEALMDVNGAWIQVDSTDETIYENIESKQTLKYSHSNYNFVIIKYFDDEEEYLFRIEKDNSE